MSAETASDGEADLVGRCYTKARRSPIVVGVIRGGDGRNLRLPGGPYTITQLGVMVGVTAVLVVTHPLWGGHGWVDAVVVVGVPFASALGIRQLHIDGRNPLAALISVLMLAAPRADWRSRPPRPVRCGTVVQLGGLVPTSAAAAAGASPDVVRHQDPVVTTTNPSVASVAAAVPSGVQSLLARRTAQRGGGS